MNRYIRIFFLLLSIGMGALGLPVMGQATLALSLEDAIEMAQKNSPQARINQLDFMAARWDYTAFKASLKPALNFNADIPGFSRSINNITQDDGSTLFRTQSLAFSSASLFISQGLPFSGGNLFVQSRLASIQNFEPIENQLWQTSPLILGLNQPIFQMNQIKWNQQEQAMRMEVAKVTYAESLQDVALEITDIFFDAMIAQKDRDRAALNVINNDTIFTISKGRYEVGKIAENELLQSELRYISAQAEYEQAELEYEQALRQMRIFLDLPANQEIALFLPNELPDTDISSDLAISQANRFSSFSKSNALRRFIAKRELKQVYQDNRFQADITATFGLNQSADDFTESYKNPADRQTFSLGINIPVFNWGRAKAERNAAQARQESLSLTLQQAEKDFDNDIFFQVMTLQQLENRLEIAARSDTVAQRRYDISKNRYLIGKISIQDLFIAQQEKDGAQQNYIVNLRQFWTVWALLKRLTLYDFKEGESLTTKLLE